MPRINIPAPKRSAVKRGVKFRKCCSRYHASDEYCQMYLRHRTSKAGNPVRRWAA